MAKRWTHWEHGTQPREHRIASYNKGCRCNLCRAAAREAKQRQRDKAKGL